MKFVIGTSGFNIARLHLAVLCATAMASVSCLVVVSSADIVRKFTLSDARLSTLKAAVQECSLLSPVVNVDKDRFQVFDEVFQRNIDVVDEDLIADKSQVFVLTAVRPTAVEIPETIHSSVVTESHGDNEPGDRDGRDHEMPDFTTMKEKMEEGSLSASMHRRIVEELYQSMVRCTLYVCLPCYQGVYSRHSN
ncbi:uncharacterized protein LOC135378585 [Ornithodoros turicata]|uniref:uncharacterized protein LOC135378585 n=1 Tax=Ornithodoros turicata TaxID=34597 RepID=UPI003138C4A2